MTPPTGSEDDDQRAAEDQVGRGRGHRRIAKAHRAAGVRHRRALGGVAGRCWPARHGRHACAGASAVDLYNEIVKLRPDWHSDDDAPGAIKVVITGAATDPPSFQPHIRNAQERRDAQGTGLQDPDDPLEIVIVRDMWLTGFDSPPMHTMYVDKPMRRPG